MAVDLNKCAPELAGSLSRFRFAVLLASVMLVSMAYGVTLPVLPFVTERILGVGDAAIAWHTGMLTTLYTFALFFFSPMWGAVSDRLDRRLVIAAGLLGSGFSLFLLDNASSLAMLYLARGLSGALSAAVLPAALASIAELSTVSQRARRFAITASATTFGFLLGPVMGSWLSAMILAPVADMRLLNLLMIDSPFIIVALMSFASAALVACMRKLNFARPENIIHGGDHYPSEKPLQLGLLLTCITVFGITAAEVGISLFGKQQMSLDPKGISRFFLVCSLVMIGVQLFVFPFLTRTIGRRSILAGSFALVTLGLLSIPFAGTPIKTEFFFALISAGTGMLIPSLAIMISEAAGKSQGKALGQQAAAANLGQALGAGSTGLLFPLFAAAPFLLVGTILGLTTVGVVRYSLKKSALLFPE